MSGGGSGGGGGGVSISKTLYDPTETAARNQVFGAAQDAFEGQQKAIAGGGTPAVPGTPYQPAVAAQDAVPGYWQTGGGGYYSGGGGLRGGYQNQGQRTWVPGTPAVAAQAAVEATPGTPAIPAEGQTLTPQGNVNPASQPVDFNPLTGLSQQQLLEFALGSGQQGVNDLQSAQSYGLNEARDPLNNPALIDLLNSTNRRLTQQFTDPGGALSQIRDSQLNAGQYGGTRQGIGEGIAAGRFAEVLGDTSAQIINNAYNTGQDTFARTLALGPQTLQTGALPATYTGAVGAQLENKAQQFEDYNASGRAFDLNAPFIPVQNYANIVNGTITPGVLSTNSANQQSGGGGIGGMLSGGLGGAGIGGMIGAGTAVGGPWGAAIGAGVGILGSLFS